MRCGRKLRQNMINPQASELKYPVVSSFPHLLHTLPPPPPTMYTVRRRQQVNQQEEYGRGAWRQWRQTGGAHSPWPLPRWQMLPPPMPRPHSAHFWREKKQTFGRAGGQVEQKQLWPCSKWMTREILSAPEKEFVLLSFMPIKLLGGGVLVYRVMTIWPTCLARQSGEKQTVSPEDLSFRLSCITEGSQGQSVENTTAVNRLGSDGAG